MAIARREAGGSLLKRVAVVVDADGFENFAHGIGLAADGAGAGGEAVAAGPADIEPGGFEFLVADALCPDVRAGAVRTALRRFGGRVGGRVTDLQERLPGKVRRGRARICKVRGGKVKTDQLVARAGLRREGWVVVVN